MATKIKSNNPIYHMWRNMKRRCNNKNDKQYRDYGGRGIKIDKEWDNNFGLFERWAINNGWEKGLQIDRIDNDKGYMPSNCRFTTNRQNSLNRRMRADNKSGFLGIYYHKLSGKWAANITVKGYTHDLGVYKDINNAVEARDIFILDNQLQTQYQLQGYTE